MSRDTLTSGYSKTYEPDGAKERELCPQWWTTKDEDAWQDALEVARSVEDQLRARNAVRLRNARLYSNRDFFGFGTGEFMRAHATSRENGMRLNVVKAVVDTASANVAKNKPRPLFLTTDGDYRLQERADGLTKYCDGLYDAAGVYRAFQRAFKDAAVLDTGCVRAFVENGELKAERVLIADILIDEDDGRDMAPQSLQHVRHIQRSKLYAMFPGKAAIIKKAPRDETLSSRASRAADLVRVYDAFHLRSSDTAKDGKRLVYVDGGTLYATDHDKDYFPYIFYRWGEALLGFYGDSLVSEIVGLQVEINQLLRQIQAAIRGAVPRAFIDSASSIPPGNLTDEIWSVVRFTGRPPTFSTPSSVGPEVMNHLWQLYAKAFEITGVSNMEATGRKEPGVDAAVAMRELRDIASQRFVLNGQRYEEAHVEFARVAVDMTRDMATAAKAKGEKGPRVKVKSAEFLETIDWKDVDLDEDKFELRVFPSALLPTEPAGRMQTVQEMLANGFITSKEEALELLDIPDVKRMTNLHTAGNKNLRWVMSQILNDGKLEPPTKYQNLQFGLKLAQEEVLNAERLGRPTARIELLYTWMRQAEAVLDEEAAKAAPPPTSLAGVADAAAPPAGAMPVDPGMPIDPNAPVLPPDGAMPPPMAA